MARVGILIRVTTEEKGLIERAAVSDGVPMSAWIVATLVEQAGATGKRPAMSGVSPVDSVPASRSQARRVAAQKELPAPTFKGTPEKGSPCPPYCGKLHAHVR